MSAGTSIEWTDTTWNPIRARRLDNGKTGWHCERISAGCAHCYASTFNGRMLPNGGTGLDYARPSRDLVETYLDEDALVAPLRWRKPRRVFLSSMTDVFGEWVADEQLDRLFAVIALAQTHTFQVLTKRPERMRAFLASPAIQRRIIAAAARTLGHAPSFAARMARERRRVRARLLDDENGVRWHADGTCGFESWPLPNVWLGVSVEDQASADARIPVLLDTPAAKRFVSAEPLLGPIDLSRAGAIWPLHRSWRAPHRSLDEAIAAGGWIGPYKRQGLIAAGRTFVAWVIVGGESGPGARPCDVAWIRSIVEQCKAASVPVFVKQLGAMPINGVGRAPLSTISRSRTGAVDGAIADDGGDPTTWDRMPLDSRKGNDPDEWPEDLRVREVPA